MNRSAFLQGCPVHMVVRCDAGLSPAAPEWSQELAGFVFFQHAREFACAQSLTDGALYSIKTRYPQFVG